jgi:transposase-like protein
MIESDVEHREKPDPEVKPPTRRRQFSEAEKRRILAEADACTERGEVGALLRREGIYSSYLTRWRRQRARGELSGKPRGPEPQTAAAQELDKLRRENARLRTRLEQAETIIEVQKKLSTMLGLETSTPRSTADE